MAKIRSLPVLFIVLYSCTFLYGQAWSGILDPSRAVDWSQAGSSHISDTRTQCTTTACNTVSGGTVTATSLNAALASAPANTFVLVPAGTFSLNAAIVVQSSNSNVTLRGAGANSTFFTFTGTGASYSYCSNFNFCAASSDTNSPGAPSNTATWSAGYSKGATSITLSNVKNLSVGNPLVLDQNDDASDTGSLWVGCESTNSTCGNDGPSGFQRSGRGQQQYVTVTSISGSGPYTVGISPGLYASNWSSAKSPGAWWATNPIKNVGFENFAFTSSSGSGGIYLFNCQGCWVKGVKAVTNFATGTGYGNVVTSGCNKCTVRDSYFVGYPGSDDYVVAHDGGSDLLVENNIMQYPGTVQFYNSDCEGCVSAYNFSAGALYGNGTANWMGASAMFHSVSLYALTEGNIGGLWWPDGYHGTHNFNTAFRNRFTGRDRDGSVLDSANTNAIQIGPGSRYQNLVGNILGTVGYHAKYVSDQAANDSAVIATGIFPGTGATDGLVKPTSMFWGNWDVVSNAVRWNSSEVPATGLPNSNNYANAVPSSQNLPDSFYLSGRPSWWPATKAWPPIGPDVTGGTVGQCAGGTMQAMSCTSNSQCPGSSCSVVASGRVVSIPAMDCYFNTMGGIANGTGGALAFDSTKCYSTSTSTVVPQSVTAVGR